MFNRARPWRARGPALGSGAGSRRRGRLGEGRTGILAPAQSDVQEEQTIDELAVSEGLIGEPTAVSAARFAEQIPAARIDEAGLRAMVWRAEAQTQADARTGQATADEACVASPLDLFVPVRSALMVVSRSRRSA